MLMLGRGCADEHAEDGVLGVLTNECSVVSWMVSWTGSFL